MKWTMEAIKERADFQGVESLLPQNLIDQELSDLCHVLGHQETMDQEGWGILFTLLLLFTMESDPTKDPFGLSIDEEVMKMDCLRFAYSMERVRRVDLLDYKPEFTCATLANATDDTILNVTAYKMN